MYTSTPADVPDPPFRFFEGLVPRLSMYHHTSEWASVVSLDSIQHEQSYFEVGLGVQLSLDWNGIGKVPFDRNLGV